MTNYELKYSKFLADISQQVAEFVKNSGMLQVANEKNDLLPTNQNNIIDTEISNEEIIKQPITDDQQTNDLVVECDTFENVDNNKVELVDFQEEPKINKTLLYILGAIIIYNLVRK